MALGTQAKSSRNITIAELRKQGWTYKRIGKRWNISRQRVEQILKKLSTGKGLDKSQDRSIIDS